MLLEATPSRCPRAIDCEKEWMFCPLTSFAMVASSKRAASLEYSGSSAISQAAVWIDTSSSSRVVAPSYRPPMVRLATRMGSTWVRPAQQGCTARTILLTSTASEEPLGLPTCIGGKGQRIVERQTPNHVRPTGL